MVTSSEEEPELAVSCAIQNYESSKTSICVLLGFQVSTLVAFMTVMWGYDIMESDILSTLGIAFLTLSVGMMALAFIEEYFRDSISPIDEDYEEQIVEDVERERESGLERALTPEEQDEADRKASEELERLEKEKSNHVLKLRNDSNRLELYLGASVIAYVLSLSFLLTVMLGPLFGIILFVFALLMTKRVFGKIRVLRHYARKLA